MSNLPGLCLSTRPQQTSLALRKPPDAGRRQAELTRHHGAAHDSAALARKAKGHRLDALILHRVDGLMSRVAGEWGQKGMVGLGWRVGGWVGERRMRQVGQSWRVKAGWLRCTAHSCAILDTQPTGSLPGLQASTYHGRLGSHPFPPWFRGSSRAHEWWERSWWAARGRTRQHQRCQPGRQGKQ